MSSIFSSVNAMPFSVILNGMGGAFHFHNSYHALGLSALNSMKFCAPFTFIAQPLSRCGSSMSAAVKISISVIPSKKFQYVGQFSMGKKFSNENKDEAIDAFLNNAYYKFPHPYFWGSYVLTATIN